MKLSSSTPLAATFFVILLLLAVLVAIQWAGDQKISDIFNLIARPHLLGISVLVVIAQTVADGMTGYTALMSTSTTPIPAKPVVAITWLANTIGITLPGPAKTPVRAIMQKRLLDVSYTASLLGLIIETLFAYLILIPATAITAWMWLQQDAQLIWHPPQWAWQLLLVLLIAVMFVVIFKVFLQLRTNQNRPDISQPNHLSTAYTPHWPSILHTFLLTILVYIFGILRLALVIAAFGISLNPGILSAIFLLSRLSGSLSMLPMGIGVRDASLAGLLVLVDVPMEFALAITVLERLLLTLPYLIAGPIATNYLRSYSGNSKIDELVPHDPPPNN